MNNKAILGGGVFIFVMMAIAVLATLTEEPEPGCTNATSDVSAAILADDPADQDALTNRAIIVRGDCQGTATEATPETAPTTDASAPQSDSAGNEQPHSAASFSLISSASAAAATSVSALPVAVSTETPLEILEHRCVVCHGCYDAPCQLKLEAHAGLERGASKDKVYDGGRLRAANLTRLFDDALSEQGWRDKGFYPVLDEKNPKDGVMYRLLQLKQAHPMPAEGPVPDTFDFSLYRDQQCPTQNEFDEFARTNPLWGMPYGLPGLNAEQHATLSSWIEQGAPEPAPAPLSSQENALSEQWERFLNGDSLQEQLIARYIYEHLFLATLHLTTDEAPNWFRIVRSSTAPGDPIALIATRRPFDDPGVSRVYYRLQRMPITLLAKTHMPYRMDQARLDWYQELFVTPEYEVKSLPGYEPAIASNPFKVFQDLPVNSRYRFLLEESRFTIMNFIKGPVCRGQIALNVIDDHFWVMFANPDEVDVDLDAEFLAQESDNLRLPTPATGTIIDIVRWRGYAKSNARYQQARSKLIGELLAGGQRLTVDSIWDGDGNNENASLTIFRHFDTASVVHGMVGNVPKTAWVIDYPLLERIHYLLVAGFDVYGAAAHQLESRLYMDFLRMEGEFNFLLFMPPEKRLEIHDYWYREARKGYREHFIALNAMAEETTDIKYESEDPRREFLELMRERIYGAKAEAFSYRRKSASSKVVAALEGMEDSVGQHNSWLPNVSFINLVGDNRDEFYTLMRNSAHSNIAQPFMEDARRLPDEDDLTIVRGFIGAYPNYFFQVKEGEIERFAEQISNLKSRKDYGALRQRYGVRRNAPWFWRVADKVHARSQWLTPLEYGIFDFSRYEKN
jgi:Fatty acid cis/trans isomerase (CTI)